MCRVTSFSSPGGALLGAPRTPWVQRRSGVPWPVIIAPIHSPRSSQSPFFAQLLVLLSPSPPASLPPPVAGYCSSSPSAPGTRARPNTGSRDPCSSPSGLPSTGRSNTRMTLPMSFHSDFQPLTCSRCPGSPLQPNCSAEHQGHTSSCYLIYPLRCLQVSQLYHAPRRYLFYL